MGMVQLFAVEPVISLVLSSCYVPEVRMPFADVKPEPFKRLIVWVG